MAQHPFPPGGPYPPPQHGHGQQPPGYGQHPGHAQYPQQQPQGAWAPAPPGPRTVFGIPLAQGERVIYYRRVSRSQIAAIIAGIFLIPFLFVGIWMIVMAAKMRKTDSYAHVVTNRRVFTVNGEGNILSEMSWSDVAGVYVRKRNNMLDAVGVRNRANQVVLFDSGCAEAETFFDRVTASMRTIDSLPEPPYDAAPPPVQPGKSALVTGLVLAGLGAIVILLALVAVQESEALWVAGLGALGLLGGGALALIGHSKAKAK